MTSLNLANERVFCTYCRLPIINQVILSFPPSHNLCLTEASEYAYQQHIKTIRKRKPCPETLALWLIDEYNFGQSKTYLHDPDHKFILDPINNTIISSLKSKQLIFSFGFRSANFLKEEVIVAIDWEDYPWPEETDKKTCEHCEDSFYFDYSLKHHICCPCVVCGKSTKNQEGGCWICSEWFCLNHREGHACIEDYENVNHR